MTRLTPFVAALLAAVLTQQTFRSGVEAVRVPVLVMNGNRSVEHLTRDDFELRDAGVPQTIGSVSVESLPVDVTLVLDASGSVQGPALSRMESDVQQIAGDLEPRDRVRLITFGDEVHQVFGFHDGGAAVPVDQIRAAGASSFYSALAAALIIDPLVDRPQLVFSMTDGRDTTSFLSADRIVELAGLSNATLYVALVEPAQPTVEAPGMIAHEETQTRVSDSMRTGALASVAGVHRSVGPYSGGPNVAALKAATARTGGAFYERLKAGAMPDAFRAALSDFRNCYLLSYAPTGVTSGGWHPIEVRVKNHRYVIRARSGYEGG